MGPLDGSLYATVSKRRSTPHSPPSPHVPNGRYAASIDSGIASSNSAGVAPISPPTSDSSRASGDTAGTAPVAAPTTPRPGSTAAVGAKSRAADARQLDELLAGMLLDIENIPDLRPCQTPAPDINTIKCPDFGQKYHSTVSSYRKDTQYKMDIPPPKQYSSSLSSHYLNGYDDPYMHQNSSATYDGVPYHTRTDSKPFSYGAVTSSPLMSRSKTSDRNDVSQQYSSSLVHKRSSRDHALSSSAKMGLESPRLVRKMSEGVESTPNDGYRPTSRTPSPSQEPGSHGKRERSYTMTSRIMSGNESPTDTLGRSSLTRSTSRLDETAADGSYNYDSFR